MHLLGKKHTENCVHFQNSIQKMHFSEENDLQKVHVLDKSTYKTCVLEEKKHK